MRPPKITGSVKSGTILTPGGRRAAPSVPVEIRDAVEQWARSVGRHADIVYITFTNPPTPQVRIELRSNDPRLRAWQEGRADEKPVETVELVEWDDDKKCYVGMNLMDLGADGVVELLQMGDTESGRGQFKSLQEGVVAARRQRKSAIERLKNWMRYEMFARAEDRAYGDLSVVKQFAVPVDIERKDTG